MSRLYNTVLKRLLNLSEESTHLRLRKVCEANGAHVFAKVRIADVLPIEGSGLSNSLYRYALQAHFDFVVADNDNSPLFAVEFDGPSHSESVQKVRDSQKNLLCEKFQCPILRVNARYLSKKYRNMDLLSWFVQVWFAQRWFDEAQKNGDVSYEEPFMPQSFVNIPGHWNQFPLWLSATIRRHIQKLCFSGAILDIAPSQLIGRDAEGNFHAISFIRITEDNGVMSESGMRSQLFPVSEIEALDEIITYAVYDRLTLALDATIPTESKKIIEARIADFVAEYRICRAFHNGGSFSVPEFSFTGNRVR